MDTRDSIVWTGDNLDEVLAWARALDQPTQFHRVERNGVLTMPVTGGGWLDIRPGDTLRPPAWDLAPITVDRAK